MTDPNYPADRRVADEPGYHDPNRPADTAPAAPAAREGEAEAVPEDAVDAQQQAFVEAAEDEAATATREAEAAVERANRMNEAINPAPPPEEGAQGPAARAVAERRSADDDRGILQAERSAVVVRAGPRHVDMVTTEEDRLVRHKQMVRAHLRNAEPDMTGGKGHEEPDANLDARTGLPKGHVPEGYQDAPSRLSPRNP